VRDGRRTLRLLRPQPRTGARNAPTSSPPASTSRPKKPRDARAGVVRECVERVGTRRRQRVRSR
jgi:hypothetical protein